ncbi:DUF6520 family protein [Flavivirga eckloniae]|uniref:Secreted protein n=1 Tax=Flavivirga eckloniae TaxID=1803846 RepID=A0A2K9PNU9_9FLAO|nr:DUF6520 family protein [Flavivirga eckloniae]AUP78715.1 hypothetical protein C1H87_08340 [Flavivirga eckloniae]
MKIFTKIVLPTIASIIAIAFSLAFTSKASGNVINVYYKDANNNNACTAITVHETKIINCTTHGGIVCTVYILGQPNAANVALYEDSPCISFEYTNLLTKPL